MDNPRGNDLHRGKGYLFGPDVVREFLVANDLELVVRAHQLVSKGYETSKDGNLVTVFSAPFYCGSRNFGCVLTVEKETLRFKRFKTPKERRTAMMRFILNGSCPEKIQEIQTNNNNFEE